MNKREFIIGLGAGLLIASTLSLAGYLSALSKWGEPQEAEPAIGQEYQNNGEVVAQNTEVGQPAQNEPQQVEPVKQPQLVEPEKVATKQEDAPEPVPNEDADNGDVDKATQDEDNPMGQEEASVGESGGLTPDSEEPEPAIEREPEPKPQPAPQPEPKPAPQPEPKPQPAPEPEPQPVPQQAPQPQPEPQPAPQPEPQPAPQPEPEESGTVKVTIGQDSTNAEIAAEMSRQGLVGSAEEFAAYLNQTGLYVKYDSGTYEIGRGASFDEIVDEIRR